MKIRYSTRSILSALIPGLGLTAIAAVQMVFSESNNLIIHIVLFLGCLQLVWGLYILIMPYLIIQSGVLKKTGIKGRVIQQNEIKAIRRYPSGNYIIVTEVTQMIINTKVIKPESMESLISYFRDLGFDIT